MARASRSVSIEVSEYAGNGMGRCAQFRNVSVKVWTQANRSLDLCEMTSGRVQPGSRPLRTDLWTCARQGIGACEMGLDLANA